MPTALICLMPVYAALGVFAWYWRLKRDAASYPQGLEAGVLAVALLLHGALVLMPVLAGRELILGFGYACALIVWLMLMLYLAGVFFYRLRGLQLLLYPLSAMILLLAVLFPGSPVSYRLADWPSMLHIVSSLLAYSLFGITALVALLMLWLSRDLHRHRLAPSRSFLPPLLSLEKMMFQGMWVGFALLTVSVISGTFFSEATLGKPAAFTHKTVFGVLSWFIYAGLLLKRSMTAWRGKRAAVWTVIGFVSLMLAYAGSKFVLEVLLHRY
ncbi:MAG: cytochrome c biogenesis protein CcsA [Neisseria sp.]|nr:cytochrome c biogenesis protein CcsA [Neisseria sp.]